MLALGISDLSNLFGMVKFYKACRGNGIADCRLRCLTETRPTAPSRSSLADLLQPRRLRAACANCRPMLSAPTSTRPCRAEKAWLSSGYQ